MKFTIESSHLAAAMKRVFSVIERRNTIPILSNVVIKAEDDTLVLRGTDLDVEVTVKVSAQVEEPGSTTVLADKMRDFILKLPKGSQAQLSQAECDHDLKIVSGRTRVSIHTLPVDDYPDMDAGEPGTTFATTGALLSSLLGRTRFAMSTEETRYYLNGIYLHVEGQELRAVATDGHRLAKTVAAVPEGAEDIPGVIIPRKTTGLLLDLFGDVKDVSVSLSKSKIRLEGGDIILLSKLIDGTFPDYERVIPKGNNQIAVLNRGDFSGAISRVQTIMNEKSNGAKLIFDGGKLVLQGQNSETGSATDEIDVDYDGPEVAIGFNARYLLETVGNIANDSVRLELADGGSPTVFRGEGDQSLLIVLMPMRI